MRSSPVLILMRHGQSQWNKQNLFTGWVDIPLSKEGIEEAIEAGKKMADMAIDVIFVSSLIRAQMSAMIAMTMHSGGKVPVLIHEKEGKISDWSKVYSEKTMQSLIPVFVSWHLNERMYGELQGLNKQDTMDRFGKEQVQMWRRSYDIAPPGGESLEMTAQRTIPYFYEKVLPFFNQGKNVLVSAHGNSLRAIVMYLLSLSKEEVLKLELATGEPLMFIRTENGWEKK